MNKKNYLIVVALVCALFCATVTRAQERLWGLSGLIIFSVNKDGSDYQSFSSFDFPEPGEYAERIQRLSNDEMLVVMDGGGAGSAGTICKITSAGAVKMYDLVDYLEARDIGHTFAEGKDGYGYALQYNWYTGAVNRIIQFSLNGTSFKKISIANKEISRTSGLTATAQGVFGVTKGSSTKNGAIFKLRTDLSGIDTIYTFKDARRPLGRLLEGRDGYFYGTTYLGGYGTIYKIRQDGSDYMKLHDFDDVNGKNPVAGLVQDAQGVLYGTTMKGGIRGRGVLFRINEDGTDFRKLLDYYNTGHEYPTQELMVDNDGFIYDPFFKIKNDGTEFSLLATPGEYLQLVSSSFTPDVYVTNPADQSSNLPVNVILQVKPFPSAMKYDIALSESPDFSSDIQKFSNEGTNFNVVGLKPGTTYYTHVKTNIWPYYGETTSFTTGNPIDQAPERLWSVNRFSMFSINKDGSDFHTTVGPEKSEDVYYNSLKLKNGDLLVVGDSTMELDGTILKITSSGVVKLYDIDDYTATRDIARSMTEGNDGYIYALRYALNTSAFWGVIRFKLDGSAYETFPFSQRNFPVTSGLTTISEGIYGVSKGSATNNGFIYRIKPDITGFDIIYNFTDKQPVGKLIQGRDGYLYGTTKHGGALALGTIYKVRPDGSDYQKLFDFDLINGRYPENGLVQDTGGVLYGTAPRGGKSGAGTLFRINEDGSDFRKLLDFSTVGGKNPNLEVTVDNAGNIYGFATGVGVYKIGTDGTGFQVLKSLTNEYALPISPLQLVKQILVPDVLLIQPPDQSSGVSILPEMQIKSFPWTAEYTFELSESANFSGDVLILKSGQPVIPMDSLKYGTVYYARIRSDLLPYYGPVTSFVTRTASDYTFIVSPAENATGVPVNGLEITVNEIPGATQYTIQVSRFTGLPEFGTYEKTGGQRTLIFDRLDTGTLYYVRAKTDLHSGWGPISTFTTVPYQPNVTTADVYPNPSSRTFTYKGSSSSNAVTVTDMSGAVVYQNDHVLPGESLKFGGNLKNGVYILRIQDADGVKTIRLLKVNDGMIE